MARECCPDPIVSPTGAIGLDWRGHSAGPPAECRLCGDPALCRDCLRRPCHKACAELELTRELAAQVGRHTRKPRHLAAVPS